MPSWDYVDMTMKNGLTCIITYIHTNIKTSYFII